MDPRELFGKNQNQKGKRRLVFKFKINFLTILVGFFFFVLRAQNRGAQDVFSFSRSRAKLFAKGRQSVTFADVAGVDEAKKELEEIVDFLKNPAKHTKIGARTP